MTGQDGKSALCLSLLSPKLLSTLGYHMNEKEGEADQLNFYIFNIFSVKTCLWVLLPTISVSSLLI